MTTHPPVVISASRLQRIGGSKGKPGCERAYAGQYLFGMKQEPTPALETGSQLHELAQHYQDTGEILRPESDISSRLAAGAHLLTTCGTMQVEWEHAGELPDGTPFVAYLDGRSPHGGTTNSVVIQDIKTTSNPAFALEPGDGPMGLLTDLQAMFYPWILLCCVHRTRPPGGDEAAWEIWDPKERNARDARLRWLYFATKGNPRAWEVNDFMTPDRARYWMQDTALPLVARIRAIHDWHAANPGTTLDDFDRNFGACTIGGRAMKWCGAGERGACDLSAIGTPIMQLITIGKRPMDQLSPQQRLAALQARAAANKVAASAAGNTAATQTAPAPAPEAVPAPKAELTTQEQPVVAQPEPAGAVSAPSLESSDPVTSATGTPSAEVAPASESPKRGRGRPPKPAAINPPESPAVAPAPTPIGASAPAVNADNPGLGVWGTEQLVDELVRRNYTVAIQKGPVQK